MKCVGNRSVCPPYKNYGARRAGQELPADGRNLRGGYRAERCGVFAGLISVLNAFAMDATVAPVSMAVELDTLATNAFRYCSGARRCGLDWMSDFFCIDWMIATL